MIIPYSKWTTHTDKTASLVRWVSQVIIFSRRRKRMTIIITIIITITITITIMTIFISWSILGGARRAWWLPGPHGDGGSGTSSYTGDHCHHIIIYYHIQVIIISVSCSILHPTRRPSHPIQSIQSTYSLCCDIRLRRRFYHHIHIHIHHIHQYTGD